VEYCGGGTAHRTYEHFAIIVSKFFGGNPIADSRVCSNPIRDKSVEENAKNHDQGF